ncbi:DUF1778 domain-containing protein [Kamptonema sp. UHCC 0994]|uniref:type II toxin-antitoxin system TacA family antitoxin n=1 Tax=Kamptonema sp. UHCC 0994 TaxID=3031329 RepID=UPI0023B9542A|nr:DUF1778 domain-containing protein [Kamptonema sp. UHCC 0994]MDF0553260.1 DUF1778 domain-containing protein [Kamptonema sp. UHCC 0994]
MTTPSTTKTMARLEARISPEIKFLLQKAADLEGLTLTDFAIASLQKAAIATIQKHQTLKLSLDVQGWGGVSQKRPFLIS